MFKKITKKDKRTNLEKEIDEVLEIMSLLKPESEGYTAITANLEKLYKAKASENERKRRVSPDTIALVVCNLAGIGLILWHEKADVITSKAFGWVMKGRV